MVNQFYKALMMMMNKMCPSLHKGSLAGCQRKGGVRSGSSSVVGKRKSCLLMKPPDPLDIDVDDDLFSSSQQIRRASEGGGGAGGSSMPAVS